MSYDNISYEGIGGAITFTVKTDGTLTTADIGKNVTVNANSELILTINASSVLGTLRQLVGDLATVEMGGFQLYNYNASAGEFGAGGLYSIEGASSGKIRISAGGTGPLYYCVNSDPAADTAWLVPA